MQGYGGIASCGPRHAVGRRMKTSSHAHVPQTFTHAPVRAVGFGLLMGVLAIILFKVSSPARNAWRR